jgi:hypothetical protein
MKRLWAGAATVLILLAAAATLSGCTPVEEVGGYLAVVLADGRPALLLRVCHGYRVTQITLEQQNWVSYYSGHTPGDGTGYERQPTAQWHVGGSEGLSDLVPAPLLEIPDGWQKLPRGSNPLTAEPLELLTEFAEEPHYEVALGTVPVSRRNLHVAFRLADLRALADGQVWRNRAESREGFLTEARKGCASNK